MLNVTFISSFFAISNSCWGIFWYYLNIIKGRGKFLIGEVRILNTANDGDPLVASSDLVDVSHKEPIAQLSWLSKSKGHSVISLGNDGKLLVWDWKSTKLEVIQTFSLSSTGIPSNLRVGKSDIATELGGNYN